MFHCLVIKVVYLSLSVRQLVYITTSIFVCQQLFLISFKNFWSFSKWNPASSEARFSISSELPFVNPFFQFFWFFYIIWHLCSISVENTHKHFHKYILIIQEIQYCILLNKSHSLFSNRGITEQRQDQKPDPDKDYALRTAHCTSGNFIHSIYHRKICQNIQYITQ